MEWAFVPTLKPLVRYFAGEGQGEGSASFSSSTC